ncbi:hypothetical protein FJZ28_02595 [Candidatus Peregrinibacteria bacterium]|nr:hypothetical protein [Candidatus Peregrinibacteria bacterium]
MPVVSITILRRYLLVVLLQCFAILLALVQSLNGVRTDEAKYLLNIPYPHPPLLRFLMGNTEAFPFQELFWRLLFATLLVQAVWIVADLGRSLATEKRVTLCLLWLTAGSLLFQAGTVMMAPITALQGLIVVWFFLKSKKLDAGSSQLAGVALFWLASLFTAYQAVLYAPVVWGIFRRNGCSSSRASVITVVPIALLLLYVAGNPLAISSFISAGGQNAGSSYEGITGSIVVAWLTAGSGILSVLGTYGALRSGRKELFISVLLLFTFLLVSFRAYYAVLFLPLFIAGVAAHPAVLQKSHLVAAAQLCCAVLLLAQTPLSIGSSPARHVMQRINDLPGTGVVLIHGSFGHEWQYESRIPILRYRSALLSKSKAVVCLERCPEVARYGFYQIANMGEEVWIRR